jgi:hypothetical protein
MAPKTTAPRPWRRTARGPALLLLIACLTAVVIGSVVEGWFRLAVVALALSLVAGAVVVTTIRPRTRPSASVAPSRFVGPGRAAGSHRSPSR